MDLLMLMLAGLTSYYLRFTGWAISLKPILFDLSAPEYMAYVLKIIPVWLVIYALIGLYSPNSRRRFAQDVVRIFFASLTGLAFIALYMLFTQQLFDSRFLLVVSVLLAMIFMTAGRLILRGLKGMMYRNGVGLRKVVLIGGDAIAKELIDVFSKRKELGYEVVGSCAVFSKELERRFKKEVIDEIIVTSPRNNEASSLSAFEFARDNHIGFKYSADLFAMLSANQSIHPLAGVPIVEVKQTPLDGWGKVIKRLFDVVVSVIVIVLVSPLLIITAIIILIETGKPILFKNQRVGLRKREFFTLKFRSMYQKDSTGPQFGLAGKDAEKREKDLIKKQSIKQGPIYKIENDPRVTTFGGFIRRWSIDELPQFFNVLDGSMSVVGPRPHQPREVKGYEKEHRVAFSVKPGITGLSQISGRSDLTYEEEMRLDILYIEKWSLWLDIIIVIKTPFVLFRRRKAL